ncbi:hypothetical protein PVL29_017783 [Vitis rotundifolia]|uniref:R13L1/DRL21-like LRR repeat region domain-containing protein n=1 Tax=Vitis rotundifolia TaxID=103349 RepID=A0AA38ZBI4_VITRO|nr:hypothetical protein PVL29_017783 [Vitis rotundifolia]
MENVVRVEDALQGHMKDTRYLDELSLNWKEMIISDVIQINGVIDNVLSSVTFPDWLGDPSFLNLGSLKLWGCGNCSTLPPLGQLPRLKLLEISDMKGVVRVGSEFYGNSSSSLQPSFPSLQTISFYNVQLGEMVMSWRHTWRIPSSPGAVYKAMSQTHWGITNTPSFIAGT